MSAPMIDPVTDEELVAFLDGELPEAEAARVEAALNADPQLAERAELLAAQDDLTRRAFDPLLAAPVPAGLVAAASAPAAPATVSDISVARAARAELQAETRRWGWPQLGAMAASLALGLLIGPSLLGGGGEGALVTSGAQGPRVSADLAAMLDTAPSGEAVELAGLGEARVDITFRNTDAALCRQVQITGDGAASDLLACREKGAGWQVAALGTRPAAEADQMRMASGEASPAVLAAVDAMIASDPLVGADERAALER